MTFFAALLIVHLACAAGATASFWTAALALKGSVVHRQAGSWFARLVYVTAATGGTLAVAHLLVPSWFPAASSASAATTERQTMWLVLYVLLIIVAPVQHGTAVARARAVPARVRSRLHATLAILSILGTFALLPAALLWGRWLFLIIVPIGLAIGLQSLAYAARTAATRREWEREHLTSQITAGVTLHTALLVFGTSRTLGLTLAGGAAILPWVVPALVGLPVISWLRAARSGFERNV